MIGEKTNRLEPYKNVILLITSPNLSDKAYSKLKHCNLPFPSEIFPASSILSRVLLLLFSFPFIKGMKLRLTISSPVN